MPFHFVSKAVGKQVTSREGGDCDWVGGLGEKILKYDNNGFLLLFEIKRVVVEKYVVRNIRCDHGATILLAKRCSFGGGRTGSCISAPRLFIGTWYCLSNRTRVGAEWGGDGYRA